MKNFNRHHLSLLPLLSILLASPSFVQKNHLGRSIASVSEQKKHPKYETLISSVKPENELKETDLSPEKFKEKREELKTRIAKEKEGLTKILSDQKLVEEQRKKIEALVVELVLVDGGLKRLQEKKVLEKSEEEETLKMISESKDMVEGFLTDLEANEALVAIEKQENKSASTVADLRKFEPREEPKKPEKTVVVSEGPKPEETKDAKPKDPKVAEESKDAKPKDPKVAEEAKPKEEVCKAEEQNKALTKQVEDLLKQNQQIMQTMMGMSQMMVSMYQQNQQLQQQHANPYFQNGPGWNMSPYQYHQPQTAGNWVYYPNGFQPQQQNIFAAPQMPYQAMPQGGYFPDQMHQQQQMPIQQPMYQQSSNWSLAPDPRFQVQPPVMNGTFGSSSPLSFNMGNTLPTLTQR